MSEDRVFVKCAWRLMPLIMAAYAINYLDRTNVGFAALTMNRDLGFTPEAYGLGAGVFFLGYLLFQVPANIILGRIGARIWISLILATWGAISASTAFVQTPAAFAVSRFLLGVAEAGFFPGMIFYLTLWFPKAYRARLSALFVLAQPAAFMIGGPLSAAILQLDGIGRLHGWQWLFLVEGMPAILIALTALKCLPDGPEQAQWLDINAKRIIASRFAAENSVTAPDTLRSALLDARVWLLAIPLFGAGSGQYGVALWLPQIVSATGFSIPATGLVVAASYFAAVIVILAVSFSSDRRSERVWHVAFCWTIAAAGFFAASINPGDSRAIVALALANAAILAEIAPMFAIPPSFLTGQACASAMALMNVFASLGGLVAPILIGALRQQSGDYRTAMASLGAGLVTSVLLLMLFRQLMASRAAAPAANTGTAST